MGRHRGRGGRKEYLLGDADCESVSYVLWDCLAYEYKKCLNDGVEKGAWR